MIPPIYGRSYAIEEDLRIPDEGAEGVLCAFADFIGGLSLWVDERGHLVHTYQSLGVETYKQVSKEPIPRGELSVKMLFEIDEPRPGTGGQVTLWANGREIGEGRHDHTLRRIVFDLQLAAYQTSRHSTSTLPSRRSEPARPAESGRRGGPPPPRAHPNEGTQMIRRQRSLLEIPS